MSRYNFLVFTCFLSAFLLSCSNSSSKLFDPESIREIKWFPLPISNVSDFFVSPSGTVFSFDYTAFPGDGPAVSHRSIDNGYTWELIEWFHGVGDYTFSREGELFIAGYLGMGLSRFASTKDEAVTWEFNMMKSVFAVDINQLGDIYILRREPSNYYSIRKSDDGGIHWQQTGSFNFRSRYMALDRQNRIFIGSLDSLYFTDDEGRNLHYIDFPHELWFQKITSISDRIIVLDTYRLFISSDRGETWQELKIDGGLEITNFSTRMDGIILAIARGTHTYYLYASTDFGRNWIKVDTPGGNFQSAQLSYDNYLYLNSNHSLYRSIVPIQE
ncbi:WD40/YVTN/BNR-like repeat-containing protein [candidate division KSB1 bacterium]